MERKNVTVILRMANACNLSCSYCYDKDNRMDTNKINEKFMENIDKIVNYVKSFDFNDNRNFNLILHGGEPLILSDEVYIAFLEKITNSIKKITISIQTNGTLLTQQKLKILDKYGVHIGISLDGSNEIQNKNRIFKNGKNSFNEVKKVIDMLNNNHSRFGIIMTLSKNNINTEQEIYDFIRENNLNCNIRPAFPTKKTEENNIIMNSNEYITFFKRLFDVWYNDNTNSIKLKQITEVYEEFLKILEPNMYRGTCENSMNCFGNFVGLDTYGNVYTCNRTYNEKEFFLGNLNQISAEEIIDKCKKFCLDRKKASKNQNAKNVRYSNSVMEDVQQTRIIYIMIIQNPFYIIVKLKKLFFIILRKRWIRRGKLLNTIKERKKESLKNKFSFGISLDISIDDYKKIIKKYKNYINGVYFSLPLGNEFHTRQLVVREYCKTDSEEKLFNILRLFKENNIKLEAVINQYNIPNQKILQAVEYIKTKLEVDSICTLDEYVKTIKKYFPRQYLVSSFNNYDIEYKKIKYDEDTPYNEIVVGRKFLRNIKNIKEIRKLGLDVKFLLNNGCSFNCGTCRSGYENCRKVFDLNMKKFTAEELYALQSFWPFELNKLNEKIDLNDIKEFKISNRPCTYEYLDNCLNSYIFYDEKKEIDFIREDINNYRLWGRLAHFNDYFSLMDIKKIEKIKNELWDLV